jgi:hypothetical protein
MPVSIRAITGPGHEKNPCMNRCDSPLCVAGVKWRSARVLSALTTSRRQIIGLMPRIAHMNPVSCGIRLGGHDCQLSNLRRATESVSAPVLSWSPCQHDLETYLQDYIEAARIADDREGRLFRTAYRRTGVLTDHPMTQSDAWRMLQRRARHPYRGL